MSACSDWLLSTAGPAPSPFSPFPFRRKEAWCVSMAAGMAMGEEWRVVRGDEVEIMELESLSSKLWSPATTAHRHHNKSTKLKKKNQPN
jgi:hypothetical protein